MAGKIEELQSKIIEIEGEHKSKLHEIEASNESKGMVHLIPLCYLMD